MSDRRTNPSSVSRPDSRLDDDPSFESNPNTKIPTLSQPDSGIGSSGGEPAGAVATRGLGGYRPTELRTIPSSITELSGTQGKPCKVLTNFVKIFTRPLSEMSQYRIDFEPNIESIRLRRQLLRPVATSHFHDKLIFDGSQEAKSLIKLTETETTYSVTHPLDGTTVNIKFKYTGSIDMSSFEMLRMYNTSMRQFLIYMGFFQIRRDFFHNNLRSDLPGNHGISVMSGFRTSASRHTGGLLLNLDSVNKNMQQINCLQMLRGTLDKANKEKRPFPELARAEMSNVVVITRYNNKTYKVEDILFNLNPSASFDGKDGPTTYVDYYRKAYPETRITDLKQPLLLARPDRKLGPRERAAAKNQPDRPIHLIPELCYITHLTPAQRDDSRLKMDMIRYSQVSPSVRVETLRQFLKKFHSNEQIRRHCDIWDFRYAQDVLSTEGRFMEAERICWGNTKGTPPDKWPKCEHPGNFDRMLKGAKVYQTANIKNLHLIISKPSSNVYSVAAQRIPQCLKQIGITVGKITEAKLLEGRLSNFARACQEVPNETSMVLVILPSLSKDIYDAVKKTLSKDRGVPSQCVTSRLLADERKAMSACSKIAIQMACKIGAEPWILSIPITKAMICGYDTYHDTQKRGRSVGAFVASMNSTYSCWWSKSDMHEQLEELSSNLSANIVESCKKFLAVNGFMPERILLYRDGVSEGQIEHVYNVELRNIKKVLGKLPGVGIKLTAVIVTKRVGARFFAESGQQITNPMPGTVIDKDVTRKERYEFYLVSQSTRQGTVAPTLYNIIEDSSGFKPMHHQMLAYKLCHLYYNWTGTVRVPAPCQYAHKLAQLVGEHLHEAPNSRLDSLLHFL